MRREFAANPLAAKPIEFIYYLLSSGFLGVPVFCLVSGYCISAAAVSQRASGDSAIHFLKRRFIRIYPAYWICLAGCLPLAYVTGSGIDISGLSLSQWLGNVFLFERYRPWFCSPNVSREVLATSWTLCYEEQFYLLTFLLLRVAPRWLFPVFGAITCIVLLNTSNLNIGPAVVLNLNRFQVQVGGLLLGSFWLFFAMGVGLFNFRTAKTRLKLIFPIIVVLFAARELLHIDLASHRFTTRVFTSFICLLLCCVPEGSLKATYLMPIPLLRWAGERSYGLYLVHLPITHLCCYYAKKLGLSSPLQMLLLTLPVAILLSVGVAHLFYIVIEKRFIPRRVVQS